MTGRPPSKLRKLFVFVAAVAQLLRACSAVSAVACVNYGHPSFGDLNGNKKTDLICNVVTQRFHHQFESEGNGRFASLRIVLEDNADNSGDGWCILNNERTTWVDIDGDGFADVSCDTDSGDHFVRIWQPGPEEFTPHVRVPNWCTYTVAYKARLVWTDVNGDGRADMVCEDESGLRAVLLTAPNPVGQYAYVDKGIFSTNWCLGSQKVTVWGYLNADGLADVVCHDFSTGNIEVQFGSGDRETIDQGLLATDWCVGSTSQLALADLNGDGHADLLCSESLSGNVKAMIFLRMDLVDDLGIILTNWCINARTEWRDLNGDGKADILCVRADNSVQSRRSVGNGSFDMFEDVTPAPTVEEANTTEGTGALPTISQLNTANHNLAIRQVSPTHTLSFEQPLQVVCSALWAPATVEDIRILVVYYNHSSQRGFYDTLSPDSLQSDRASPPVGGNANTYLQELPGLQRICTAQDECNVQCSMTAWPPRLLASSTAVKRAIVWSLLDNNTFAIETERVYVAQEQVFGFFVYNDTDPCVLLSNETNAGLLLIEDVITGQTKWSFAPSGTRPLHGAYVLNGLGNRAIVRVLVAWRRLYFPDAPLDVELFTIDDEGLITSQALESDTWPWLLGDVEQQQHAAPVVIGDDFGDVAIVSGAAEVVALHWLVRNEIERHCCLGADISRILQVSVDSSAQTSETLNHSIEVVVQTTTMELRVWTLGEDEGALRFDHSTAHGEVLEVFTSDAALLVMVTNGIESFDRSPKHLQQGLVPELYLMNAALLAFCVMLVYCVLSRSAKSDEEQAVRGKSPSEEEDVTPEQLAASDGEDTDELPRTNNVDTQRNEQETKGNLLSFSALFLGCIGMQSSLSKFTVYDLPDYDRKTVPLCPARVCKQKRISCFRTHCVLTIYLCFVAFTFSPNLLGRVVGPAASTSKGKICEFREQKLLEIETQILEESNYGAGELQLSDMRDVGRKMLQDIEDANDATPNDPPFINFPMNASGGCSDALDAKYEELQRQIDDDTCTFEKEIIEILRDIRIRDYFFWIEVDPVVYRVELPPIGQRGRQCPVDASLIDDIEMLKAIINKNFQEKTREFADPQAELEAASSELLKTLMFQANVAADVYIFYVCLCLLIRPPLRLSRSKLSVNLKRRCFHWEQIQFVFYFTLAAYFVPIVWKLLNLEELFRLLKNASVDLCYVQPSFIADISKSVVKACSDIEALRDDFFAEVDGVVQTSKDAHAYFLCEDPPSPIDTLLGQFELQANVSENAEFTASVCNDIRFDFLVAKHASPEVPDKDTTLKFLGALLTLTQIFGKFILVNFGLGVTKFVDPLSFHDGKVEVIETDKNLNIPPALEVANFLRTSSSISFGFHLILTFLFCVNMAIVLDLQTTETSDLNYSLFCLFAFATSFFAAWTVYKLFTAELHDAVSKSETGSLAQEKCRTAVERYLENCLEKCNQCKSWLDRKRTQLLRSSTKGGEEDGTDGLQTQI